MEIESSPQFDWANDAFLALHDVEGQSPPDDKWPAYSSTPTSLPPAAFTVPPGLVNHASIERYGQVTPPDELSPALPEVDCPARRDTSLALEQLQNDLSWPVEQQIRDLANYQPEQEQPQSEPQTQAQTQSEARDSSSRASKRRRTSSKMSLANQDQASPSQSEPQHQQPATNPEPPKRKRGRPKAQPQVIEGFTADGFPFQVTSARQSHLEKNRVAAHKCRQRKKEYIGSLESRAREYSGKNKMLKESVAMLREEVLELKNEVLRHAGCGFWAVDEYLARCAGDLLNMENPAMPSRPHSQLRTPTITNMDPQKERQMSIDTLPSHMSAQSMDEDENDFGGFDLVNDFDQDMDGADE